MDSKQVPFAVISFFGCVLAAVAGVYSLIESNIIVKNYHHMQGMVDWWWVFFSIVMFVTSLAFGNFFARTIIGWDKFKDGFFGKRKKK